MVKEKSMRTESDPHIQLPATPATQGSALTEKLTRYLEECSRPIPSGWDALAELLGPRPHSEILQVITNQFAQAFMHTLEVTISVDRWHDDVDQIGLDEFTLHQEFVGDFIGEVYLNLSEPMMLRSAKRLLVQPVTRINAMAMDAACEFLNVINGNASVRLSQRGYKVEVKPPRCFCHPRWGERCGARLDLREELGHGTLTAVILSCPEGSVELCIVDRSL